jgi:hypothetical protein
MNTTPAGKPEQPKPEASIRDALDAVDRSALKGRLLIAFVIAGAIALAVWFDLAARNSVAPTNAVIIRAVAIIVAMLTLATLRLRNEMSKNTRAILRAIADLHSNTTRTS